MLLTELKQSAVTVTAFHGRATALTMIKPDRIYYFTPDEGAAKAYARGKLKKNQTGYLYKATINLSNPKVYDSMQGIGSLTLSDVKRLKNEGYDGAIYHGDGKEPIPEVVPFEPEKLKLEKISEITK